MGTCIDAKGEVPSAGTIQNLGKGQDSNKEQFPQF